MGFFKIVIGNKIPIEAHLPKKNFLNAFFKNLVLLDYSDASQSHCSKESKHGTNYHCLQLCPLTPCGE